MESNKDLGGAQTDLNIEEKNYNKIKSKYILEIIFENLRKKKLLLIIKPNKRIQNRINISINDYKEYCEKYSQIEIEIIPNKEKGEFIYFNKKENENYFHIYFNDNKDEIKRKYLNENDNVKKIKILIDYQIKSFYELFRYCKCIDSISFPKFYRTNIENMNGMFYFCSSLKNINLSNVKTDNVTDMSYMFGGCSSLVELDLTNLNTNNVNKTKGMFLSCTSLKKLNISNFNINKVKNISYMFAECKSLETLNISSFNTSNVNNMENMFSGCISLIYLDVSNFVINDNTSVSEMFKECPLELLNKIRYQNDRLRRKYLSS